MSDSPDVWEPTDAASEPAPAATELEPAPEAETVPALPASDPDVSVTAPRAALSADAKSRALRTAVQTTAVTAIAAVLQVGATYLHDGDVSHLDWKALAMAALVAGGTPVASFLHRMLGE
jgi:hypothetical protein